MKKSNKIAELKGKAAKDVNAAAGTDGLVYRMTAKGVLEFYREDAPKI